MKNEEFAANQRHTVMLVARNSSEAFVPITQSGCAS